MSAERLAGGATQNVGGRPRVAEDEYRGKRIGVRVNAAEHKILLERAAEAGMTTADFLRRTGLGYDMPKAVPALNRQAYRELGAIVRELEVMAVKSVSGGPAVVAAAVSAAAERVSAELQLIRLVLLGADGFGEDDEDGGDEE